MNLQLDEARRLTGPNLLWDHPGAVVDVLISGVSKQEVAECWQRWVVKLLPKFEWQSEKTTFRLYEEGANLALSAPMDALYTACEIAELAWHCAAAELSKSELPDWQQRVDELLVELNDERNPALLTLLEQAGANGVTCLMDDDDVSLGLGASVDVWPAAELPAVEHIDWQQYADIPRAFITGTNGKSTSVRLAAEVAKAAGINAGVTSTDFIRVGEDIIDRGDYSGPGGARMLLRDRRTEMAFLEVARGGMLRRGLPLDYVDAALVTNVAADHLGQYGINTVEALAETKFIVSKGLDSKGVLVVNADNELVVNEALKANKTLCWFSLEEQNPLIQKQLQNGGRAVFLRSGQIIYHHNGLFDELGLAKQMPMTFDGTAKHNIQNALGVVGLCRALKLPLQAIRQGLQNFGSDAQDNPGRGNMYQVKGCKVVVDFAHNEHSMRAVVDMASKMPANNRIVLFGHGGDRRDSEIKSLTDAVMDLQASHYILTELEDYLRGRELGEIPELVEQCLLDRKINKDQLHVAANPIDGAKLAVELSQPGDVLLLFVLDQREQVHEFLSSLG